MTKCDQKYRRRQSEWFNFWLAQHGDEEEWMEAIYYDINGEKNHCDSMPHVHRNCVRVFAIHTLHIENSRPVQLLRHEFSVQLITTLQ